MGRLINIDELINSFDNSDFDNTDPADNLMNAVHIVNSMPYVEAYSKEEVIVMLNELQLEIEEMPMHYDPRDVSDLIQQKIEQLKGNEEIKK